jgi:pimeloyl-ACP methyl ester carboxylesterase
MDDMTIRTRRVVTDTAAGIELDLHEAGRPGDPVVVLAHGFPESSHSWRHQMLPLAEAGFHVLCPDQRGYGRSSAPRDVAAYRVDHLCADLLALLDDVGAEEAVFVGHDWGSLVVWAMAQLHPERVRSVVAVSVPFTQWPMRPTELFAAVFGDRFFYMSYFQPVGPAETELDADVRTTMHTILWAASGALYRGAPTEMLPAEGKGFLDSMRHAVGEVPAELPDWLTAEDLDHYVDQFTASGFFGPVSWYRNLDADHDILEPLGPGKVTMPSYFIGGTHDGVIAGRMETVTGMAETLPDFRGYHMIEGAGHWTQQEAPEEFNAALLAYLRTL